MTPEFDLFVFTVNPELAIQLTRAGVAGVVVDWENKGKIDRQAGADTEINFFGPADLRRLRTQTDCHVLCRVNGFHAGSRDEVESAIECGANEILLPMVRSVEEVEQLIRWTEGRCGAGILIETVEALSLAPELSTLPLKRIYAGLNDLAIDRRSQNLFEAVIDGTLDRLRQHVTTRFGFGGLTIPEGGNPIPCRLLRGELLRLHCSFTFLRRSFWRDVKGRDLQVEVQRILESVEAARARSASEIRQDRLGFRDLVLSLSGNMRRAAEG